MTGKPKDPQQELNDLRAALMHILRLRPISEPGPQGLTVLHVRPDHELIAEVQRLRQLADQSHPNPEH
jgi:hypothetical protein